MNYMNSWLNKKKLMKVYHHKNLFHPIAKMLALKNKENNDCLDFDFGYLDHIYVILNEKYIIKIKSNHFYSTSQVYFSPFGATTCISSFFFKLFLRTTK